MNCGAICTAEGTDGSVIVAGTGSGSDASSVSSDLTSGVVKIFTEMHLLH